MALHHATTGGQYPLAITIVGDTFPTYASLPEVSLEMRPPRKFSLGFGTIKASFWRCAKLLPEVSPAFDRTGNILGEICSTYASLPEVSLEMRHPREFSVGFGSIKASFWRCRKIRTYLDLLSIPRSEGDEIKISKRLGGIIGCKNDPLHGI